jgi:serine/threonine protein phosphatase 1
MKTFVIGDVHGRRAQLNALIEMLPRKAETDTLVFLGDLIDRGADAPGVVGDVLELKSSNPERVICLRGNHEQMFMDFVDGERSIWLSHATGGERTFEQYTNSILRVMTDDDVTKAREHIKRHVPDEHLHFIRQTPLYHEDDYALYVHAGLDGDKHPRETEPNNLLWSRDMNFYKNYRGKPCIFGHTPTNFLPLRGRLGRHGIYICHSAIGIDTGYIINSPLSCLSLPDFTLYQAFADGQTATHHITMLIPESLRAMQRAEKMRV